MKRFLGALLVLLMLLPAVAPWLPHGAVAILHDQQAHHADIAHADGHDHGYPLPDTDRPEKPDHKAHMDALTFLDSLHVDLKNPPSGKILSGAVATQDMPAVLPQNLLTPAMLSADLKRGQGPPLRETLASYHGAPVYLATLRLRI